MTDKTVLSKQSKADYSNSGKELRLTSLALVHEQGTLKKKKKKSILKHFSSVREERLAICLYCC